MKRKDKIMKYLEAPKILKNNDSTLTMFMAGGITNCPDWQQDMRKLLSKVNGTLINPRRADFPIGDPTAAQKQITWEHDHLKIADAILFWFPMETLCPIVLYELGAWSMFADRSNKYKPIFVGVHPEYKRRQDVEIQTKLVRPEVHVQYSLKSLAVEIKTNYRETPIRWQQQY
jgi:hypothetical protein